MRRIFRMGVVLALMVAPVAARAQVRQQGAATAAARRAVDDGWAKAVDALRKGDVPALAALYTPDAMLIEPDMANVSGKAAIARAFTELLKTMKVRAVHRTQTSLEVYGDIAIDIGQYEETVQETGKAPTTVARRYTIIWKQLDGRWLAHREIAIPAAPPEARP